MLSSVVIQCKNTTIAHFKDKVKNYFRENDDFCKQENK